MTGVNAPVTGKLVAAGEPVVGATVPPFASCGRRESGNRRWCRINI